MKIQALAIAACAFALSSCEADKRPSPKFQKGQMVKMTAFGNVGMVVGGTCYKKSFGGGCFYSVRFSSLQLTTDTRILGADGPIEFAPVAIVHDIREFELEALK